MTNKERIQKNCDDIIKLKIKLTRIEALIWYVAGSLTLQFGQEIIPVVSALLG